MNEEIKEKIKAIADTYGYDVQSRQCIEEMAELTQAINKFWRKILKCGKEDIDTVPICDDNFNFLNEFENLMEEIADLQIMLWQMEYLLNTDIECVIEQKLDRQLERIKGNGME